MDFVLDELIVVMFLLFVFVLVFGSVCAVFNLKKIIATESCFKKKPGVEAGLIEPLPNVYRKLEWNRIFVRLKNHWNNRHEV